MPWKPVLTVRCTIINFLPLNINNILSLYIPIHRTSLINCCIFQTVKMSTGWQGMLISTLQSLIFLIQYLYSKYLSPKLNRVDIIKNPISLRYILIVYCCILGIIFVKNGTFFHKRVFNLWLHCDCISDWIVVVKTY